MQILTIVKRLHATDATIPTSMLLVAHTGNLKALLLATYGVLSRFIGDTILRHLKMSIY